MAVSNDIRSSLNSISSTDLYALVLILLTIDFICSTSSFLLLPNKKRNSATIKKRIEEKTMMIILSSEIIKATSIIATVKRNPAIKYARDDLR
jgi:hypothetical protein